MSALARLVRALLLLCAFTFAGQAAANPPVDDGGQASPEHHRSTEAQVDREDAESGPVIAAGREGDVLLLLRPNAPGRPIAEGWSIGNVSIERQRFRVELIASAGQRATLRVGHPAGGVGEAVGESLAVSFDPVGVVPINVRASLLRSLREHEREVRLWSVPAGGAVSGGASAVVVRAPWAKWLLDGAVMAALGLCLLLAAAWRHLRDAPRYTGYVLAAVVAYGAFARLTLSIEAPMNAWPYSRVVPLARALYESAALAAYTRATGATVTLVGVVFATTAAMAILTPLAVFAHARVVLRDVSASLAAALLMAALPAHVRFSRSDVEFIQSLLASSMTFIALYGALSDPSRAWRRMCQASLPLLCLATYLTRPENLVFFPLDVAAFAVAASDGRLPRRRLALVAALVAAPALIAAQGFVFARYRAEVGEGMRWQTLLTAFETLRSLRFNTLLNVGVTPPWFTLLAGLGLFALWTRGERRRALLLALWLAVFFVVHSYVVPHEVAMQARYHLHLATPFVLLAAAAVPWVIGRSRAAAIVLGALTLAAPWMYRGFVRDVDFYEMREFAFLRRASARVPDGCTVLEFRGVPDPRRPEHHFDSRWRRFASRVARGSIGASWRVVTADRMEAGRGAYETLSEEAREVLRRPPPCTMVYAGLSCIAQRPERLTQAPVCEALQTIPLRLLHRETIVGRVYDSMNIGHPLDPNARVWETLHLLPAGTPVTLSLYRVEGAAFSPR